MVGCSELTVHSLKTQSFIFMQHQHNHRHKNWQLQLNFIFPLWFAVHLIHTNEYNARETRINEKRGVCLWKYMQMHGCYFHISTVMVAK